VVRRGNFLTPSQRILITHILCLAVALGITMLGGSWVWLAVIATTTITVATVSRLLVQRSGRIVFTRSLEPAILVIFGQLYLGLLQLTYELPLWQQAGFLMIIFVLQIRYLLMQFRSQVAHTQTGFTALLLLLVNTTWVLMLSRDVVAGFITIIIAWLVNYIVVHYWLERIGYHNSFLAAVWSLIAVEMLVIASSALVFYTIPLTLLVVSRTALFLAVIAYTWGSMLALHSRRKLSKKLVVEYGMICGFLLIALLVMTGM
jgi:hypothetical protein